MDKFLELLDINGYKISTIILIVLLLLSITNIDKILLLKSWIYGLFSKPFGWAKKKQISNKVRAIIMKSVRNKDISIKNILPDDLKVVWVNQENHETFINNNQVIVRIKQSSDPNENLVTAVSEYVNKGLLYNVKRYLNEEVINASRILMIRKIIQTSSQTSLTYLDENYIIPKFKKDDELYELYEDLCKIDNNGMFIGILLNELNKAGMSIYGEIEDPELVAESKEFMRFLFNIANKISTNTNDLCFNRDYFKVAIFLSASNKTLKRNGTEPFIKAASQHLTNGIETLYIFGLGQKIEIAHKISKDIERDFRISNVIKHPYKHVNEDGKRISGVFYECITEGKMIMDTEK